MSGLTSFENKKFLFFYLQFKYLGDLFFYFKILTAIKFYLSKNNKTLFHVFVIKDLIG